VLPDLLEHNDLLDAVGRNEAVRHGGERSSSVEKVCVSEGIEV
jgi:hypothetical protein